MKKRFALFILSVILALILIFAIRENISNEQETFAQETQIETTEECTEPETEMKTTIDIYEAKAQECLIRQEEISTIADDMEWFIAYKGIIEEFSEWVDPPLSVYDMFTEEEIHYMLKAIETEVHGKDFISKCNVASVILNRLENSNVPTNAVAIVTSPNQFAYYRDEIEESTVLALEYVVMCGRTTYEALYFRSDIKLDSWRGNKYLFTDAAGHHFYAPIKEAIYD